MIEGSLEVKLPTIWTEKQRWEESEKRRDGTRRDEKRKSQKKEDASARNGRKVAKHSVFPMICGSEGSKSRLAEAAGAEPSGQMRDEKVHAVVARSTFASEKAKNTSSGALLEVEMSKKCTPLWREAHVQVKMYKTHQVRTTFGSWDVEKVWKSARCCGAFRNQKCSKHNMFGQLFDIQMSFRVAGARDCAPCQKWAKREGFVAFPKTWAVTCLPKIMCLACSGRSGKRSRVPLAVTKVSISNKSSCWVIPRISCMFLSSGPLRPFISGAARVLLKVSGLRLFSPVSPVPWRVLGARFRNWGRFVLGTLRGIPPVLWVLPLLSLTTSARSGACVCLVGGWRPLVGMLASLASRGWLRLLISSVVCAPSLLRPLVMSVKSFAGVSLSRPIAALCLRGVVCACRIVSRPRSTSFGHVLVFRVFALSPNPAILALPVSVGRFAVRIPSWSLNLRWSVKKVRSCTWTSKFGAIHNPRPPLGRGGGGGGVCPGPKPMPSGAAAGSWRCATPLLRFHTQAWDIFAEDRQRCILRGRRSTRDMFIRDVRRSGRWCPERHCILEHQIFSFGKMILRDRCGTSYDLASLFRGRRSTLRWSGKIAKRIGTRPSALHSTFHFWRKSRTIASFLTLSSSKVEEVSRNCCVFDVVTFKWLSFFNVRRF